VLDSERPILAINGLTKRFEVRRPWIFRTLSPRPRRFVHAVEDVSFSIPRGTTLALVGESGCGKSTIARCIAGILSPTAGSITFADAGMAGTAAHGNRQHLQMIFQDPYASLNPRWRAGRIIAEPIVTHRLISGRADIEMRINELLSLVGLAPQDAHKYPHQFSGGQRQRVAIARALASEAPLVICDEPTSALDASVQAQILNLMRRLQPRLGLTYLLISHNLAVVAQMADNIGVMYLGHLVEYGEAQTVFARPLHPYTRMLLDAVPDVTRVARRRQPMRGEVPSPIDPPPGCAFHPRCPLANARCAQELPREITVGKMMVACHAVEEGRIESVVRTP
jgi:peptide/nickel transport system ATP-binding protein